MNKRKKFYLFTLIFSFIIYIVFLYFPEYSIGVNTDTDFNQAKLIVKDSGGMITDAGGGGMIYARMNLISYVILKTHSKNFDFVDFEFRGREDRIHTADTKNPTVNSN